LLFVVRLRCSVTLLYALFALLFARVVWTFVRCTLLLLRSFTRSALLLLFVVYVVAPLRCYTTFVVVTLLPFVVGFDLLLFVVALCYVHRSGVVGCYVVRSLLLRSVVTLRLRLLYYVVRCCCYVRFYVCYAFAVVAFVAVRLRYVYVVGYRVYVVTLRCCCCPLLLLF